MDYLKILKEIDVPYFPGDPLFSFNCDGSIECNDLFVTGVGFDKSENLIIGTNDGNFYYLDEMPYFADKDEGKSIRDNCRIKIEAYRFTQDNKNQSLELFMAGFFLEDETSTIEIDKNFIDYALCKYSQYLVPGVIIKIEVTLPGDEKVSTSHYLLKEDGSYVGIEVAIKSVQEI